MNELSLNLCNPLSGLVLLLFCSRLLRLVSFLDNTIESSNKFDKIKLYLNFSQNSFNLFSNDKYRLINLLKFSVLNDI